MKQWYQQQLRIVQTVLREIDLHNYRADDVVDYLRKVDANCIVVNAGGIIDFFDNQSPLSRPNRFLNGQDMLGELISHAQQHDIKVMVRVDFRGVDKDRYEQKPEWFAMQADGSPQLGWQVHRPCYNGIYSNAHAVDYITRLMSTYNVDGIWENALGFGLGPCYCKTCKDLYKRDTGNEIPVGADYTSSVFKEYRIWKAQCVDRHITLLRNTVKSFGHDKAFCAEIFGMFHSNHAIMTGVDLYHAKDSFDFLVSPAFQDGSSSLIRKYDTLTYAATSIRFLKSIDPNKQAVLLYGNNGTKWRYIKSPAAETRIWLWEAASVGGGYWNCLFNGQHPGAAVDRRNAGIEKDVYHYLKSNSTYLQGQQPVCDVGIFYSKVTRDALGNDDETRDEFGVFIRGIERVLIENHIQYTFIPDLELTEEKLAACKAVLLPNSAYMSSAQMEIFRRYVHSGGGLIASYKTSLYDEKGNLRDDFGLKDLFGVSYTGIQRDTAFDAFQLVRQPEHPLLINMEAEKTQMLMNEGSTLLCKLPEDSLTQMVLSYVPPIPNQPPEYAWIPDVTTDYVTAAASTYGKGKVIYFANQTDKLCWTNGHEDFINLYANAIQYVLNRPLAINTNAPASVHMALMRNQEDSNQTVLSCVNTTSSTMRPIRSLVPVTDIWVDLCDVVLDEYTVMKQDGAVRVETINEDAAQPVTRIWIDRLDEFAAVHIKAR